MFFYFVLRLTIYKNYAKVLCGKIFFCDFYDIFSMLLICAILSLKYFFILFWLIGCSLFSICLACLSVIIETHHIVPNHIKCLNFKTKLPEYLYVEPYIINSLLVDVPVNL